MTISKISVFLLAICASFTTNAQLHLSPEGGFNLCNIQDKGMYSTKRTNQGFNRLAYRIGIAADVAITRHFSLQPGLFYAKKGQALRCQDLFAQRTFFNDLMNFSYLELPIRIEYKSNKAGTDRFIMGIGAYAAYAVGGRTTWTSPEWTLYKSNNVVIGNNKDNDIAPLDFGVTANIGYEFACGLFIRSYYNYGLANINAADVNWRYFNTETGISTGYRLPLKRKPVAPSI